MGVDGLSIPLGNGTSVGGSPAVATMAVYEDPSMAGSTATLAVVTALPHTADGVAVEVDGTTAYKINVLQDGVYAATVHGEIFGAGTTGGVVAAQFSLSGEVLSLGAEGAVDAAGEFDATLGTTLPMHTGDSVSAVMGVQGGSAVGNTMRVVMTKIG